MAILVTTCQDESREARLLALIPVDLEPASLRKERRQPDVE